MDHDPRDRRIAALVAIVQTMMPELYCDAPGNTRRVFDDALGDDEPLALAIAEALTEEETDHAFAWARAPQHSPDEELKATPVAAHLRAGQRVRARVMLVAHDAADAAFTAAVGPRDAPRRDVCRALAVATVHFVEAMTRDALAQRAAVAAVAPGAAACARIAALAEPWRSRARRELAMLEKRIERTLGGEPNDAG